MFHQAAFSFTASNTGAGVFVTVPSIIDQFLTTNANNRFIIPQDIAMRTNPWRIAAAYLQGTGTSVARVNNATLRRIGLPSITPVVAAAAIPSLLAPAMYGFNGPRLPYADEFGIEADNTGANVQTGFIWLHDGVMNPPAPGDEIFTLQWSATITAVANTWTNGAVVFTQTLPVGRYRIVGMDAIGTTLIAARLANPYGGPRPGILARGSTAVFPTNVFRNGNFGSFMDFTSYAQPTIDIFDSAAGAVTVTGYFDCVKLP